jgi:hypothetical protein
MMQRRKEGRGKKVTKRRSRKREDYEEDYE